MDILNSDEYKLLIHFYPFPLNSKQFNIQNISSNINRWKLFPFGIKDSVSNLENIYKDPINYRTWINKFEVYLSFVDNFLNGPLKDRTIQDKTSLISINQLVYDSLILCLELLSPSYQDIIGIASYTGLNMFPSFMNFYDYINNKYSNYRFGLFFNFIFNYDENIKKEEEIYPILEAISNIILDFFRHKVRYYNNTLGLFFEHDIIAYEGNIYVDPSFQPLKIIPIGNIRIYNCEGIIIETYNNNIRGQREGEYFKFYYQRGHRPSLVKKSGYYNRGSKDGEWLYFNPDGCIQKKITYMKNNVLNKTTYYPRNIVASSNDTACSLNQKESIKKSSVYRYRSYIMGELNQEIIYYRDGSIQFNATHGKGDIPFPESLETRWPPENKNIIRKQIKRVGDDFYETSFYSNGLKRYNKVYNKNGNKINHQEWNKYGTVIVKSTYLPDSKSFTLERFFRGDGEVINPTNEDIKLFRANMREKKIFSLNGAERYFLRENLFGSSLLSGRNKLKLWYTKAIKIPSDTVKDLSKPFTPILSSYTMYYPINVDFDTDPYDSVTAMDINIDLSNILSKRFEPGKITKYSLYRESGSSSVLSKGLFSRNVEDDKIYNMKNIISIKNVTEIPLDFVKFADRTPQTSGTLFEITFGNIKYTYTLNYKYQLIGNYSENPPLKSIDFSSNKAIFRLRKITSGTVKSYKELYENISEYIPNNPSQIVMNVDSILKSFTDKTTSGNIVSVSSRLTFDIINKPVSDNVLMIVNTIDASKYKEKYKIEIDTKDDSRMIIDENEIKSDRDNIKYFLSFDEKTKKLKFLKFNNLSFDIFNRKYIKDGVEYNDKYIEFMKSMKDLFTYPSDYSDFSESKKESSGGGGDCPEFNTIKIPSLTGVKELISNINCTNSTSTLWYSSIKNSGTDALNLDRSILSKVQSSGGSDRFVSSVITLMGMNRPIIFPSTTGTNQPFYENLFSASAVISDECKKVVEKKENPKTSTGAAAQAGKKTKAKK